MNKKLSCVLAGTMLLASMLGSFAGCKKNGNGTNTNKEFISVSNLNLGEKFNSAYYPETAKVKQRAGVIDVVIIFDGFEDGWIALKNEYERLHSGAVFVNLNTSFTQMNYQDKLLYELQNPASSDWDIIQGNLTNGASSTKCINMYSEMNKENAYAGNKVWSKVLEQDAYITDKTGENTTTYILNTEGLQTAWFINTVALEAAGRQGYLNKKGEVGNPVTWDDLMSLCSYMQEAGYENPLGISLDADSIKASQFTWLLRVYGDYYYRNEYQNLVEAESDYVYDCEAEYPETDKNFEIRYDTRLYNSILDQSSENYVGAESDKFKEFIGQFEKMKDYLLPAMDVKQTSLKSMRELFQTQSKGNKSPQIVLDYAGSGLAFQDKQNDKFQLDFFDYPYMETEYVEQGTLVRDVGGNGGYLSIIGHNQAQNELNTDFLKFVMSPYGQTIYYNALTNKKVYPKGLTLVKNDLVVIPQAWKTFFETDKISFTGLADNNRYISTLIRYMMPAKNSLQKSLELWQSYLAATGSDVMNTDKFATEWDNVLFKDWEEFCKNGNYNKNSYKYPGKGLDFGG